MSSSSSSTPPRLVAATNEPPSSSFVTPLLTDMYQLSMAYAYWKGGRSNVPSVFDMFFRVPPFGGELTVFCGLEEVLRFIQVYHFTPEQIAYVRTLLPHAEEEFWTYLSGLDCSEVRLYAIAEGSTVFPRVPLLRVEGPLGIVQLLETTLLNLCNYASLVCTNAVRHRLVAGPNKTLLEFGLRRAQGSDGGMSASHYSYVGGFDGTSNVAAGMTFGMKPSGTMAHSLVCAYAGFDDLKSHEINGVDIVAASLRYLKELGFPHVNGGETAAFIAFSQAFSDNFLALVDTYDTLNSGVPNFIAVALALRDAGFTAKGLRLDSGDLAYLSREARKMLE
jgi:nicotinate phosphoribosyltransferase